MAKIDAFFNLMMQQKASDLHMASGSPPILRISGELRRVDYPPLESDALKAMEKSELVAEALGDRLFEWFLRNKRREWRDYKTHVSAFELDRYLRAL